MIELPKLLQTEDSLAYFNIVIEILDPNSRQKELSEIPQTSIWFNKNKQDERYKKYCRNSIQYMFQYNSVLGIVKTFISNLNYTCRNILKFEDELKGLIFFLRQYEIDKGKNIDSNEKEIISLTTLLCNFFLCNFHELKIINTNSISDINLKGFMHTFNQNLSYLNSQNFQTNQKSKKRKIYLLNSFTKTNVTDYLLTKNIYDLRNYSYNNLEIKSFNSFEFESINDFFDKVEDGGLVFIMSHGNEHNDFFPFVNSQNDNHIIYSSNIAQIISKRKIELLSVLSCADQSFRDLNQYCTYLIYPSKSGFVLSELFLKSFLYHLNHSSNIIMSFNIARYATLFGSFENITVFLDDGS